MSDKSYSLSRLMISGTPYEIGVQLGRFGAAQTHNYLVKSAAWATVQEWKGSARAESMAQLTQQLLPNVWSELKGLAKGLDLPLDDVFLWNARGDLWAMAPDGCTSILIPAESSQRIFHNEDGDPGFADHCAIAQCDVEGQFGFASFVYPASLPGHTLAVNNNGLAMTVNNIRALHVDVGLPRMMLTRAILDTTDVASAIQLLQDLPRAGAFNLNMADAKSQVIASVEYRTEVCSVLNPEEAMLHANHAIHHEVSDFPQIITGTSGYRQRRGNSLLSSGSVSPLDILADDEGAQFSIFRRSTKDTDNENTLATADITIHPNRVLWQIYEDPRLKSVFSLENGRFISA